MNESEKASLGDKEAYILRLMAEPWLAHQILFKARHPASTPAFHLEIVALWHSSTPKVLIQAFRGAAKSTLAEEAIIVQALFRQYHNGIILGETYERAVERLRAIKHELETNPIIQNLFGGQVGTTWAESKIVLTNGVIIQAFGRGQSLRGSKHLDYRPDRAFADDIENEDSVVSPEAIEKTKVWLMATVLPALEPDALVRINGTPLHPRSVICQLAQDPAWICRVYPILYKDDAGAERAIWPERFPLADIEKKRADYQRLGMANSFAQEFMCQSEDPATKPFSEGLIRVDASLVRTWHAVYACVDPARSVRSTSASTGVAIWSWLGNRLIVWDAFAGFWMPDEIVKQIFEIDSTYSPVTIGIERDGLEEFILQPLRHEQLKRGYSIPIRALRAPEGKIAFISGLQPYFKAGEVVFAKECKQAREQFLNFPSGRIDIPNALAYALALRGGQPVYDNFNAAHVAIALATNPRRPLFLAVHSDGRCTACVLVQVLDGQLHVLADRVREGEPALYLGDMIQELTLGLPADRPPRFVIPPGHYASFSAVGLRAALRALQAEHTRGGDITVGRNVLNDHLARLAHGRPALQVAQAARWTLNGFAGGYHRELAKSGTLTAEPTQNAYRVLFEALESFAAILQTAARDDEDMQPHYDYTPDGRRFITSRPGISPGRAVR